MASSWANTIEVKTHLGYLNVFYPLEPYMITVVLRFIVADSRG